MSGELDPPNWPPRSPYEAAMTSPSGRQKLLQRSSRLSPSPSPLRKSATTPNLSRYRNKTPEPPDEGEDEDEETLQLRLQVIEARLKLKKLQQKKVKGGDSVPEPDEPEDFAATHASTLRPVRSNRTRDEGLFKSKSATELQVPLSPDKRKTTIAREPRSPGRVLLGIDKGLKGNNVSLKRPPSLRTAEDPFGPSNAGSTPGSTLSRHRSNGRAVGATIGKSFNERIAESRDQEKREFERRERIEQMKKQRSKGFGFQEAEIELHKRVSLEDHQQKRAVEEKKLEAGFSREDVLRAVNRPPGGLVSRTNTISGVRNSRAEVSHVSETFSRPKSAASERSQARDRPSSQASAAHSESSEGLAPAGDATLYEPYSSSNLSRRFLPHGFVKRTMEEKSPVTIPRLLTEVKAPAFELPDELATGNLVVFATIATKSKPFDHKNRTTDQNAPEKTAHQKADETIENDNGGKWMALVLTDMKWTLDLYLFNAAYTRWSKLTPGTLVAILNPDVMPPPKHKRDTGRWSLKLNSSEDTILEIGTNKDLGWCKAVKKDGNQCPDWVDKRKTEYCEFHVDAGVERMRRGRMDIQGPGMGFAPGGKQSGRHGFFGTGNRGEGGRGGSSNNRDRKGQKDDGLKREGRQYDRSAHSAYFMAPPNPGRSAASLLDADEYGDRSTRQERARKALADQEKEREVAKKLGSIGGGAGAEYLSAGRGLAKGKENKDSASRGGAVPSSDESLSTSEARDALSLGLKGNKSGDVMLSPLKRKRSDVPSGTKKKTRFVTSKGIREAGRESLPGPNEVDLDDGLDIV